MCARQRRSVFDEVDLGGRPAILSTHAESVRCDNIVLHALPRDANVPRSRTARRISRSLPMVFLPRCVMTLRAGAWVCHPPVANRVAWLSVSPGQAV